MSSYGYRQLVGLLDGVHDHLHVGGELLQTIERQQRFDGHD
jgi:hypothetical protein